MDRIIVSRHIGALEWLAEELDCTLRVEDGKPISLDKDDVSIPIFSSVKAKDVVGKCVIGNLPLHLASLAREVMAIEFANDVPRGIEYSSEQMKEAGARLVPYIVLKQNK